MPREATANICVIRDLHRIKPVNNLLISNESPVRVVTHGDTDLHRSCPPPPPPAAADAGDAGAREPQRHGRVVEVEAAARGGGARDSLSVLRAA
jgi:hypothetical protein